MERQIKFRGKNIHTGEWLYGDLLRNENGAVAVVPPFKLNEHNECSDYEVDECTVGQFTGLLDAKQKEIYEGDIIRTDVGACNFADGACGTVTFLRVVDMMKRRLDFILSWRNTGCIHTTSGR